MLTHGINDFLDRTICVYVDCLSVEEEGGISTAHKFYSLVFDLHQKIFLGTKYFLHFTTRRTTLSLPPPTPTPLTFEQIKINKWACLYD